MGEKGRVSWNESVNDMDRKTDSPLPETGEFPCFFTGRGGRRCKGKLFGQELFDQETVLELVGPLLQILCHRYVLPRLG